MRPGAIPVFMLRGPSFIRIAAFRLIAAFLLIAFFPAAETPAADRTEGAMFATRSVVYARHGMVAAAHPLAAQIGVDLLKSGASAVDAAIGVNAALGFLEPVSCGIGGDLFAIVWDAKSRKLYGLNGSGRSPNSVHTARQSTRTLEPCETAEPRGTPRGSVSFGAIRA